MKPTVLWYVAYGSNMAAERLRYYLAGGRPPGGARTYPGCRDCTPPLRSEPVTLPGGIYFALESRAWGGGLALYDPSLPGRAPARAYLLTVGQFSDLAAQEMYREPAGDLDLAAALGTGRHELGPGRYETLLHVGDLDGHPMLTFTAPWSAADVQPNPPAAVYLRLLGAGLRQAHGWRREQVADYLSSRPGAAGWWTAPEIADLLADQTPAADPRLACE